MNEEYNILTPKVYGHFFIGSKNKMYRHCLVSYFKPNRFHLLMLKLFFGIGFFWNEDK